MTLNKNLQILQQNITRKRVNHNITQSELADAVGVSNATLCRWEANNFSTTKMHHLIKLIKFMEKKGVKFDEYNKIATTDKTTSKTARCVK